MQHATAPPEPCRNQRRGQGEQGSDETEAASEEGDESPRPFSWRSKRVTNRIVCWSTRTPERVQEICENILARGYDLTWYCLSRVETMTPDLARVMRRAGCRLVSFGIESGNEEILQNLLYR